MDQNEARRKIAELSMQVNTERKIVDEILDALKANPSMAAKYEAITRMIERKRTGKDG